VKQTAEAIGHRQIARCSLGALRRAAGRTLVDVSAARQPARELAGDRARRLEQLLAGPRKKQRRVVVAACRALIRRTPAPCRPTRCLRSQRSALRDCEHGPPAVLEQRVRERV
jgi:hypothetical protein